MSGCFCSTSRSFQSTRPRGARPKPRTELTILPCFNPRARGGRDWPNQRTGDRHPRFNPRARGGRDASRLISPGRPCKFQSTRPRGARHERVRIQHLATPVSIHAPAGGATSKRGANSLQQPFQSTRPRGARPCLRVAVSPAP